MQIYGGVEFRLGSDWLKLIEISSLLLKHSDLYACLFGVHNYAGYVPLFADRGFPSDCSESLRSEAAVYIDEVSHPSWVLWSELQRVDWEEAAIRRDERIHEFILEGNEERFVTKWLNHPGRESIRDALNVNPESIIRADMRIFRRPVLKRIDCLEGTDFPLLMKLMGCLAERFGEDGVRMVVWFA